MKKKVLLMGASGSGKTSMRSVIFSNNPASLTSRLGATIDVEQNHVRFLGDLILNLWDCGGQDSFMESYLTSQRSTIFQQVGVLIYVFDIESQELDKDVVYYRDCLEALRKYSPNAGVFLLVHKVDLVREAVRESTLDEKKKWLREWSGVGEVTIYGTSIYDESLYKAWSRIVHTLIPNASLLAKHLTMFAEACNATEVIMFERTTFLVIATSSSPSVSSTSPTAITSANQFLEASHPSSSSTGNGSTPTKELVVSDTLSTASDSTAQPDGHLMEHARYERTSEIIKFFKHSCSKWREEFFCHEMEFPDFTLVLDELTRNTYIMVVVHDPTIETAAIKMNIRLARQKFEDMQSGGS